MGDLTRWKGQATEALKVPYIMYVIGVDAISVGWAADTSIDYYDRKE